MFRTMLAALAYTAVIGGLMVALFWAADVFWEWAKTASAWFRR